MIDLTGQQFGFLTVKKRSSRKTKRKGIYWLCQCDCGKFLLVRADNLRSGRSTKCSICRNGAGCRSVFVKDVTEDAGVV